MRIVKPSTVRAFWMKHPDAEPSLENWLAVTRGAHWANLHDVRRTLPHADAAGVRSGGIVTIFNISGNEYRLISAIHCNTGMVFVLAILTHEQYSRGRWKGQL